MTTGRAGRLSILLVALMAARSAMMTPMLAMSKAMKINAAARTPYFSRIRSARPRRVTRVRRMPISWVTANKIVMITEPLIIW
jgi:hypothetical protein